MGSNQWDLTNGFRVRGMVSSTAIETCASVSKKRVNGLRVGVEIFNNQGHQSGSMIGGTIGDIKYEYTYFTCVSDSASDHNFGLRF